MLICRYDDGDGPRYGVVVEGRVSALEGDLWGRDPGIGSIIGNAADLRLLPPVMPSKIICVGRNYAAHAKELGNEVPEEPLLFFKPSSALIGQDAVIEILPPMGRVDHEAEMAVVIGRQGRFIRRDEAQNYILGYTCANDVSDRDFQKKDGQWTRAKGFDTFCPLGPWINTELDASNVTVTCYVNGERRQEGSTSQLIFDIPFLLEYISGVMTLFPGDVILTGTPSGVGPLQPGDEVEVNVDGIGTLRNTVASGGH